MFLRNCWYVAAYDREIGREPFGRTLLNEPVVLYRQEDGTPVALEDRCCHRGLPLSLGRVEGNRVRCGYHGLVFDETGACVEVPGQSAIPPGANVKAYPVVERYRWIWIWMGDPALADAALIPDWWWADDPEWGYIPGRLLHIACDYELITDNLLDLTHLAYVHSATIGTGAITDFPVKSERLTDRVRMSRWVLDGPPPPTFREAGGFTGNVDRWQAVDTLAPCHSVVYAGCAPVEAGIVGADFTGRVPDGINIRALNAPTPETDTSTFYFYGHARDFRIDDEAWAATMYEQLLKTFLEDVDILEAQQRSLDGDPDAPLIDINVDAPGLAAREMLRQRIKDEARVAAG